MSGETLDKLSIGTGSLKEEKEHETATVDDATCVYACHWPRNSTSKG